MKFGPLTDSTSLLADVYFWAQTDSASLTKADVTRSINEWYRTVNHEIWHADRFWDYDDANATTLPNATRDLVSGTGNYELPSTAQRIKAVEVKDKNGNWVRLKPFDIDQLKKAGIAYDEFEETDGIPEFYDMQGRSIVLKPAPAAADVTTTEGLKIHVSREIIAFSSSATTREPGFDENYHRILSLGASQDQLIATDADNVKLARVQNLIEQYRQDLAEFYGARQMDSNTKIDPSQGSYHRSFV